MKPEFAARFKTPEAAARYSAAYDATLALWPVIHNELDIPTRFGTTHVNTAGSADAPPVVLLHGAQISSTVWYANVEPLSRQFRIYAPDVVDQTGRSVPTQKLKTAEDCAGWLTDVLDALKLERVMMIGHSQGCWLTLNLAFKAPQRLERIVLLSPGPPFVRLRWQLLLRMLPVFIRPTRDTFYRFYQSFTTVPVDAGQPNPVLEQLMIGSMSYKPNELSLGMSSLFSDDELRQINTSILLLIGEKELFVDPARVLERARRVMPHIEAEMIANAGHLMPVDQADAVNDRMLAFLKG
jgi:pimeloyl-ACP methyl ester carboxylesterase